MRIIATLLAIVMPGLGQLFNGHVAKAFLLLLVEHTVNTLSKINQALYFDFNGYHHEALGVLNFQFALFYPAIFCMGIWDAFFHAKPNANRKAGIYFIIAGFTGTFAILYAALLPFPTLTIGLSMIVPILIGVIIYRGS